jgi:hypothetical protein
MAIKIYNGSSWMSAQALKIYNGSSWVNAVKGWVFDGSNWRQNYPELPVLISAPTGTWPGNYNGYGEARAGAQVTMTSGTWSNSPTSYTYEFFAAPYSNGNAWSTVQSASSTNTWTPSNSYAGYYIKCRVTAINARGSTSTDVTIASLLNPPGISSASLSYNSSAKTATISWSPPNGWTGSYVIWYQYSGVVPYSVFHQGGTSFTFNYGPYQSQGLTLMGISVGTAIQLAGWPNTGSWYDGYVYQTVWYFP